MSKRTVIAALVLGVAAGTTYRKFITSQQAETLRSVAGALKSQIDADTVRGIVESDDPVVFAILAQYDLDPKQGFTYQQFLEAVPLSDRTRIAGRVIALHGDDAICQIRSALADIIRP
ncbi:MAG: hypothetical protein PVI21_04900 [Candidatus Woesebacteria bacterium]|jgi:hypothetical protein